MEKGKKQGIEAAKGQFLLYKAEDGKIKIDVRLEDETVWLTQQMMAELFQTTRQNVSQHIFNMYEEGELVSDATDKKFLSVRQEGSREVKRNALSHQCRNHIGMANPLKIYIEPSLHLGINNP